MLWPLCDPHLTALELTLSSCRMGIKVPLTFLPDALMEQDLRCLPCQEDCGGSSCNGNPRRVGDRLFSSPFLHRVGTHARFIRAHICGTHTAPVPAPVVTEASLSTGLTALRAKTQIWLRCDAGCFFLKEAKLAPRLMSKLPLVLSFLWEQSREFHTREHFRSEDSVSWV